MTNTADYTASEIRAELARRGISQKQLAATIKMNPHTLSRSMRGERSFRVDELFAISQALHIAFANLFPDEVPA